MTWGSLPVKTRIYILEVVETRVPWPSCWKAASLQVAKSFIEHSPIISASFPTFSDTFHPCFSMISGGFPIFSHVFHHVFPWFLGIWHGFPIFPPRPASTIPTRAGCPCWRPSASSQWNPWRYQQFATEHMAHLEFMDTYGERERDIYIYIQFCYLDDICVGFFCWIWMVDRSEWYIYIEVFRCFLGISYHISYLRWSDFEVSDFFCVFDFGGISSVFKMDRSWLKRGTWDLIGSLGIYGFTIPLSFDIVIYLLYSRTLVGFSVFFFGLLCPKKKCDDILLEKSSWFLWEQHFWYFCDSQSVYVSRNSTRWGCVWRIRN